MRGKIVTGYKQTERLLYATLRDSELQSASTIFSDDFCRLNTRILSLTEALFPARGKTAEEGAGICVALLMGYNATSYDNGDKEAKKQVVLDRAFAVLELLPASVLKCKLLLCCYGEVYEEELLEEAREIVMSWGDDRELTQEEVEVRGRYEEIMGV